MQQEAARGEDKLFPARLQRVSPPPRFEMLHAAHLEHWNGSILDPTVDEFVRDICRRLGKPVELAPDTRAELSRLPPIEPLGPVGARAEEQAASEQLATLDKKARGLGNWMVACFALVAVLAGGAYGWDNFIRPMIEGATMAPTATASTTPTAPASVSPAYQRPNDPLLDLQWYLGPADAGGAGILAYREQTGADGSGITIAHIDTGVFERHDEFLRSSSLIDGYDMVSDPSIANDGDGRDPDPTDPGDACNASGTDEDSFHGTISASLIAANTDNGIGMAAVAPGAKLLVMRAVGKCGGRLSDINDALMWAGGLIPERDADGNEVWNEIEVDIALIPVGLFAACPPSMQNAVDSLRDLGILVMTSAGNGRVPTANYAPGGCNGVIAVGATDLRGALAPYTNSDVALVAPGGDLTRDDDGDSRPDGIIGAKYATNCLDVATGQTETACEYSFEQGTSMAAAISAGALALLWSQHPDDTPDEITARFLDAAIPLSARQCSGACEDFPGATPVPGLSGICERPCGAGRLDLARAAP